MVIGPDTVRKPRRDEFDEIHDLLVAAFDTPAEAKLVRQLRNDGAMAIELVKPWEGNIGAYVALSRMQAPEGWLCLAPIAVRPKWQGGALTLSLGQKQQFRFGSRLLSQLALSHKRGLFAKPFGEDVSIVVLGKPSFYQRAGFSLDRARNLTSPYPLEYTLILRHGEEAPEATLVYPSAFEALG